MKWKDWKQALKNNTQKQTRRVWAVVKWNYGEYLGVEGVFDTLPTKEQMEKIKARTSMIDIGDSYYVEEWEVESAE